MPKALAVAAITLVAVLTGCDQATDQTREEPVRAIRPYVVEVSMEPSPRRLAGTIEPAREALLAFPVAGTVENVRVEIGETVEEGQVLATLDEEPYRLQVAAARAELGNAEATLRERREHYTRQARLLEDGWVSEARYDQALASYEVAQSELERAERQLDLAQRDLDDTQIEAPFSGRISARMIEPFQEVPAGEPVLEVQDPTELEVRVLVPETLIQDLRIGDPVEVDVPAIGIEGRAGHIRDIGARALAANAFPTQIALADPRGLLPGMTAEVTFVLAPDRPDERTFLVPPTAILAVDELDAPDDTVHEVRAVFAYRPDEGLVRRVPVEIRDVRVDRVEIAGSLAQGDVLAETGVEFLFDGQRVMLLDEARDGARARVGMAE